MTGRTIWAISDGTAGMANQALGLAEAVARLGRERGESWAVVEKTVVPQAPWSMLPARFWLPGVSGRGPGSSPLDPPWPALAVSCGRQAVGPALHVGQQSGGASFVVHAQHPRTAAGRFDLILTQSHDRIAGPNVMTVTGSMNRVASADLDGAAARFRDRVAGLPRPLVAVLIGGSNNVYRMTEAVARRIARALRQLTDEAEAGLLVTASRRTGEANIALLRETLTGDGVYFWDGTGENPYFAFLALADAIVVTCDSVNMVSEACFTGKPVHVLALEGGENSKFERFHAEMREAGRTRPFEGRLECWSYAPLDETRRVAAEVLRRLDARRCGDRSPHGG